MTTDEQKIARLFGSIGDTFDDQAEALKLAAQIAGGEKGVRERPDSPKLSLEDCLARASRDSIRLGLLSREIESVILTGEGLPKEAEYEATRRMWAASA